MRILVIAQRVPYPPNKGEKLRTYHQIKYLKEQGHQVYVAAPYEHAHELVHFEVLEHTYCQKVVKAELGSKLFRLAPALLTGASLSAANFYSGKLQKKIDLLLEEENIEAVLCSASSLAPYVFKSQSLVKIQPKLLMDFMDLDSDKWQQYSNNAGLPMSLVYSREARKVAIEEQTIANKFDCCFLATDKEVELFYQRFPEYSNIYALENGLDTSQFYPPNEPRKLDYPRILFAGVMDYKPNIDAVLWFVENVWDQVLEKWPQAEFCIAGMNPTDKIKSLEQIQGIKVTGFVDNIKPYFDQANLFVAPFRIARGVQNKVLQAMACGLPVIATEMGAEGIPCKHGEQLMIANTAESFEDYIASLISKTSSYQQIFQDALLMIHEKYEWDSKLAVLANQISENL